MNILCDEFCYNISSFVLVIVDFDLDFKIEVFLLLKDLDGGIFYNFFFLDEFVWFYFGRYISMEDNVDNNINVGKWIVNNE